MDPSGDLEVRADQTMASRARCAARMDKCGSGLEAARGLTCSECASQSPARCDLEGCTGKTTVSRTKGANLEDCTMPQNGQVRERSERQGLHSQPYGFGLGLRKQASAGAAWSGLVQLTP